MMKGAMMATVDFTLEDLREIFATKEDLARFATKEDLAGFATKDDIQGIRFDMKGFATKEDLAGFATKEDIHELPTRDEVRAVVQQEFDKFEPRVQRIVKLETMDAEARIKTDIKGYIDVEHKDLKERLGRFGKAAASLLADGEK